MPQEPTLIDLVKLTGKHDYGDSHTAWFTGDDLITKACDEAKHLQLTDAVIHLYTEIAVIKASK